MDLIVVIVNYATPHHVIKNLDVLIPELRTFGGNAVCWIVDNCSPDNSISILNQEIEDKKYHDFVTLIPSPLNGGFGAGNNVAINKANTLTQKPNYFYFLNPDAVIMPGTVKTLMDYLKANKHVGVVGGPVLDAQGQLEGGPFRLPSLRSTIEENLKIGLVSKIWKKKRVSISPPPTKNTPVGWVSGANLMARRIALDKVGIFDENFFLYFEEIDLCRRIAEHGNEIHYLPDAKVIHDSGASTGLNKSDIRLPEYWHNSRSLYLKKAFGSGGLFIHNLTTVVAGFIGRVYGFLRGRKPSRVKFLRDIIKYNFKI